MSFDYGKRKNNGQFENYPVQPDGPYKQAIRNVYKHSVCGHLTIMSKGLAETYAKHPGTEFYQLTFCAGCREHLPLSQFYWVEKGFKETEICMTETAGQPGLDLTCEPEYKPKWVRT